MKELLFADKFIIVRREEKRCGIESDKKMRSTAK